MYSVHCYSKLVLFLTVHSPQVPGHLHEGRGGTQDQPPRVQSPGIELGSSLQPQDQPPRVQSPGIELDSSLQLQVLCKGQVFEQNFSIKCFDVLFV